MGIFCKFIYFYLDHCSGGNRQVVGNTIACQIALIWKVCSLQTYDECTVQPKIIQTYIFNTLIRLYFLYYNIPGRESQAESNGLLTWKSFREAIQYFSL